MNYYPFHLGDYTAHTAHLEPLEDLAYRRMLDAYYLREAPLPADPAEVARLIRMRQNMAEVEAVLREFFQLTEDGWRHARCDDEIERMQDKQAKARASAAASVNARRAKAMPTQSDCAANAERTLNDRSTDVELPTPTPTPIFKPNGLDKTPGKRAAVTKPDSVSQAAWDGFMAIRKAKRAPLSAVALSGIEREASKAGKTLNEALTICCERGWQAFRADWVESVTAAGGRKLPARENFDAVQYGETGLL